MATQWFPNLPIEEPSFFHQWQADSLEQFTEQHIAAAFGQPAVSSESDGSYHPYSPPERVQKQARKEVASATLLCFGPPAAEELERSVLECVKAESAIDMSPLTQCAIKKRNYRAMAGEAAPAPAPAGLTRSMAHNQEHILAERKRREKLSQRFIALSKIVPGLKKMDKASVLGDAIKYVKQLQEQVKALEDQASKRPIEAAVLVKKCQLLSDDDGSSSESSDIISPNGSQPLIEAKMSEKSVLIKIQCENRKGVLIKALAEVERLNLTVTNTNAMPFTANSLDVTIMAQAGEEFNVTMMEIVRRLSIALKTAA